MFPSIPLFPPFTVIYPLSVSASVSETPIYSNSIPYRTAHSLWNKVFFSIAVQWTADTPALFLPPHNTLCHQHPIAHGLTYHHFDSGPVDLFLMGSACSSVNLTVRRRLFAYCTLSRCRYVCRINEWGLVKCHVSIGQPDWEMNASFHRNSLSTRRHSWCIVALLFAKLYSWICEHH